MYGVQMLSAAVLATVAFAMDLRWHKISNIWIGMGWLWGSSVQLLFYGGAGAAQFFAGAGIPVLWLFFLFYFRMLGPGDIKLLSVLGGMLGYRAGIYLIIFSFLIGGILSLGLLITSGMIQFRFRYFADYFRTYLKDQKRMPYYKTGRQAENFHFTLPVLLAVFLYVGGCC